MNSPGLINDQGIKTSARYQGPKTANKLFFKGLSVGVDSRLVGMVEAPPVTLEQGLREVTDLNVGLLIQQSDTKSQSFRFFTLIYWGFHEKGTSATCVH